MPAAHAQNSAMVCAPARVRAPRFPDKKTFKLALPPFKFRGRFFAPPRPECAMPLGYGPCMVHGPRVTGTVHGLTALMRVWVTARALTLSRSG